MDNNQTSLQNFFPVDKVYKYFVDGQWQYTQSKYLLEVYSPVDTSLVGFLQSISVQEAENAIHAAKKAFPLWSETSVDIRAEIIKKAAKILESNAHFVINMLCFEIGKTIADATDEVFRTVKLMEYYAEEGRRVHNESLYSDSFPGYSNKKIAITKRVPLGPVLTISPFNYPVNEGAPKIVGALIAGNTVIFKPSTQGAISALCLVECFRLAGIPNGVLNAVTGQSTTIGDVLVGSRDIAAINITGSLKTAEHIREKMGIIPLIAGLSGKDAAIVLEDADLKLAIPEIAKGAFSYAGQRCTAIKRIIVLRTIAETFIKQFTDFTSTHFVLGDPRREETTQGPVINMTTVNYLDELLEDAVEKGAKIELGGFNKDFENRHYYKTTILSRVTEDMRIAWEEPFGPILPILVVDTIEEAVLLANKSEFGLQSSVFTQNINNAFSIAEKLDVGTVQLNGKDARGPDHFPFIGVKGSGIGNVQGAKYLIESMSRIKTIVINKNY